MEIHTYYMSKCITAAEKGIFESLPNPCVGALLLHNGNIIGEGITSSYGGNHAEVNAINSVKNKELLKESTLYVTLEPCSHFGKTPPCTDLIIESKIPRVVVGTRDPFEKVNGRGIQQLIDAGIEVVESVLSDECYFKNRRFFTFHIKKRPYIILKWAQTQDGFIDKKRKDDKGINWITHKETKKITHQWRSDESAIAVGTKTVEIDNPILTVREVIGKNPIRIVIDKNLKLDINSNVFNKDSKTLIFNEKINEIKDNLEYIKVDFNQLLSQLLDSLYQQNIVSLIIEGGERFLQSFIDKNIWDEARVITGGTKFEKGILAPTIEKNCYKKIIRNGDLISFYKNT